MSGLHPVTIVVPAHDPGPALGRLLHAINEQAAAHPGQPVVVVDDASPQALAGVVDAGMLPHLHLEVVRRHDNGGPGAARNTGLQRVGTPWVAFIDADMVPGAGWLARLRVTAARHAGPDTDVDAVEGRVTIPSAEPPGPFSHATEILGPSVHLGAGNVAYRTEVLRSARGFDERFYDRRRRLHFREDAELHFRLEEAGVRIVDDPHLVAEHPPLPRSYCAPLRLARRYHFDPLLSRLHPDGFRRLTGARRVGPISLRRARHDAALALAAGVAGTGMGLMTRKRHLTKAAGALAVTGWVGNMVALCWRRRVRVSEIPALAVVAALVPFPYLWHYGRGVLRYRHLPALSGRPVSRRR